MLKERTPVGVGEPADNAEIVTFLASDGARSITDEKIRCDAGIR